MIIAMASVIYPTMKPIKTIYVYADLSPMYVVEARYMDCIGVRNLCDTAVMQELVNDPNNIKFHKVFLSDTEIVK